MTRPHSILIANRGEIAIRIARAASALNLGSAAIYSREDADSLHVRRTDQAIALPGRGAAAYLDIDAVVGAARSAGSTAVHPGYGFLSESAAFAEACAAQGLAFIGPDPRTLRLFGDKAAARAAATDCGVPVLAGTAAIAHIDEAIGFFRTLNGSGMLIKATSGGGGRGMRAVMREEGIEEAMTGASSEALAAFGCGDVYCEELIQDARHIEVQILGDGAGRIAHFGERECSLQRRRQKLVEVAPSPSLDPATRDRLIAAAMAMAKASNYRGLGTFEFLIDRRDPQRFVFIEANPRLQVEHTITEEVYGLDLVQAQIQVCLGLTVPEAAFCAPPVARGYAIQLRVNMESMREDGSAAPESGVLARYELPGGRGVRVDGFGYVGYRTNTTFDSLLAKLIVHCEKPDFGAAVKMARDALSELRIDGVRTNSGFLAALLDSPALRVNDVSTTWIDENIETLVAGAAQYADAAWELSATEAGAPASRPAAPAGTACVAAPLQGSLARLLIKTGDLVQAGQPVAVLEAMKMEHSVNSTAHGTVHSLAATEGDVLSNGSPILYIQPREGLESQQAQPQPIDLESISQHLADTLAARALTTDAARPAAVTRRHSAGMRTARENIADLVDEGSFVEYGGLAIAAQRARRDVQDLRANTPADGIVTGMGTVNAKEFGEDASRTFVAAYDYTVLAGTQGYFNHKKQDRLFELAARMERPLVLFAEGGGGRPGDIDKQLLRVGSLDVMTFKALGALSGLVPIVGVAAGRCFAGNAALLGCCDTIIATTDSNIGMGGPAMIEGGGLGVCAPEDIGPSGMQYANGVIDILVEDEVDATAVARKYLSYFQGPSGRWECVDQRVLRHCIPENRVQVYDIRTVIDALADTGSVLELRRGFAAGMVTSLIRIEGIPVGVFANNPMHLGGAIDGDAADKAARFMSLCDAHRIPLLSLCDTPGFMVGPEAEKTAQVRRFGRMFIKTASLQVPLVFMVLRKAYGLGAMSMAGGSSQDTDLSISWPTGEFGGMGFEGLVRLGFKKELEAIADPVLRDEEFRRRVAALYQNGKAINAASVVEIDDVIDPVDSRRLIKATILASSRSGDRRRMHSHKHVDPW